VPLKIAAKVDRVDQSYRDEKVHPMVQAHPNVEFIGEINEQEKAELLGKAAGLLFPIDWPEPFGLVMIEAMACGTPIIALRRGSVPEVVEDGVSGFIVDNVEQAVAAVHRITDLDRATVRAAFERRFTAERMAKDYVDIYHRIVAPRAAVAKFERGIQPAIRMPTIADNRTVMWSKRKKKSIRHRRTTAENASATSRAGTGGETTVLGGYSLEES
jgi:hypothetical protein